MKSMYARQLALLDNLVQTQHKTQHKTRTQLAAVERQYHRVRPKKPKLKVILKQKLKPKVSLEVKLTNLLNF